PLASRVRRAHIRVLFRAPAASLERFMTENRSSHIRLTSHPGAGAPTRFPIAWGAETAAARGPVVGSISAGSNRNAIAAHGGSYAIYGGLAVCAGALNPSARPDLTDTAPVFPFGPYPQWRDARKIVSIDPWGADVATAFKSEIDAGLDIRPTIAVTKARL